MLQIARQLHWMNGGITIPMEGKTIQLLTMAQHVMESVTACQKTQLQAGLGIQLVPTLSVKWPKWRHAPNTVRRQTLAK